MSYQPFLYDSIGNRHERKNRYLWELSQASPAEQSQLKAHKNSHPYIQKLKQFRAEEKTFLNALAREASSLFSSEADKEITSLKRRLFRAEKKLHFYRNYVDLDYDAELEVKKSEIEIRYIPEIVARDASLREELRVNEQKLREINPERAAQTAKEINEKITIRKQFLNKEINDLKTKQAEGIISQKACRNEINIRKRAYQEDVEAIRILDEKTSLSENIKSIKHYLKTETKTRKNVMESDISDTRRKTPIEVEKERPLVAYLSFLFPGLGQWLNGQKTKAALVFIGSLFIYLLAVPYALGFGNYQGSGISGLITLAEGGRKLDKSIMFMIEGVIAMVLLVLAIGILYLSFSDVLRVEKDMIKGTRRRTWFETKQTLSEEGFPYLVSSPAMLLIIFIVVIPVITTLLISFTNLDPDHQNKFQWFGFSNYSLIILGQGIAGKSFWLILGWTLIWTFGATTVAILIGFVLSLLANQDRIRFKGLIRAVYLLPWAVPAFISIMFFSLMVSRNGPITELIRMIFHISLDIKNDAHLTRLFLILLQGWLGSSYIFLLTTGILQGIPKDLYEAAEIDGATGFQRTLKITIPLVLFQISPLLISQYTFNFNNFSIIHLFNEGGPFAPTLYGNLAGSSDILISYIYKLAIVNNYQAIGAAITMVISVVLMFFAYLGFRNTKAFKRD